MRLERLGELDVRITGGTDGRGGGDGPIVVLLHGFGAPGNDLVPLAQPLAQALGPSTPARFVFPAGPLELPGFWGESRAWWMIDMDLIQRLMANPAAASSLRGFADHEPDGLDPARERVLAMLSALRAHLGADDTPLVLGGFSQGAMLSCDIALRTDLPLSALVLLSGTLMCSSTWIPGMPARAGLPVFQSHGQSDPLLAFRAAEALHGHMQEAGLQVSWHPFAGAHEIPLPVLQGLAGFLREQLA
ncbi:alpha/beta hydrolase [Haliangium sp.]|uniref:alpha/beta hydrolase n=1 Tax=Haliangium sp. TaxID=2663208 RepID=UPI003D0A69D1